MTKRAKNVISQSIVQLLLVFSLLCPDKAKKSSLPLIFLSNKTKKLLFILILEYGYVTYSMHIDDALQ